MGAADLGGQQRHTHLLRTATMLTTGMHPSRPTRTLPEAGRVPRGKGVSLPLGPNGRPLCRWCQLEILAARRRTFCSSYCVHQWRLRSDPGYVREQVLARDRGVCSLCATDTLAAMRALKRSRGERRLELLAMWGLASVRARRSLWDADHIVPVAEGGGQCDLDNIRTLCLPCHREVTAELRRRLQASVGPGRSGTVQKGPAAPVSSWSPGPEPQDPGASLR